ncbi:AB hydrolase-1 domain-containing protein, partial [Haematococcus lacustris]
MSAMGGGSSYITAEQNKRYWQGWPSPSSFFNALHWSQIATEPSPRFRKFDYGPEYNLSRIASPVYLLWGGQDQLAAPRDCALTMARLSAAGALAGSYEVQSYQHMDFIWDLGVATRAYGK